MAVLIFYFLNIHLFMFVYLKGIKLGRRERNEGETERGLSATDSSCKVPITGKGPSQIQEPGTPAGSTSW